MNFTCPYCGTHTTITTPNRAEGWESIYIVPSLTVLNVGLGLGFAALACPNTSCRGFSLAVRLTGRDKNGNEGQSLQTWKLLPESSAKPQPEYIPNQIVEDYQQACRIKELSPKASAALSRRCLQGIIRDFHGIKKGSLAEEINALKGTIPTIEWDAIDALRSVGNIGAHMEKDVNLIIDVEPEEAEKLITLIEYIFRQWYIRRHDDEESLAAMKKIAENKAAQRKPSETEDKQ
jgi:hypothetical protein